MTPIPNTPPAGGPKPLTVSQVNALVGDAVAARFPGSILVEGELSGFKPYSSGHWYFSLKDAGGQLRAVMFRGDNARCTFRPKDGDKVLASGNLKVYRERGEYQLYVSRLQPAGLGDLQRAFEELKRRLEAEGLFAAERKRPIPAFPRVVGVVTSPSGAAVRDIIRIIRDRHAGIEIVIRPALVQGKGAAADIAAAIAELNRHGRAEVLIVGRGGGSIEDLWAFNEEPVARAIAGSAIPVISAVGHETDYTIADFVADERAATPSHAAMRVAPERAELLDRVGELWSRARAAAAGRLDERRARLADLSRRLGLRSPRQLWADRVQRVDELRRRLGLRFVAVGRDARQRYDGMFGRLRRQEPRARLAAAAERLAALRRRFGLAGGRILPARRDALAGLRQRLRGLGPQQVLGRGYSIVRRAADRQVVRSSAAVAAGDRIEVTLAAGSLVAAVEQKR